MRSKVVLLLVFALSFTIVHDTVLTWMEQKSDHPVMMASTPIATTMSKKADIGHEIHDMFHFVAIVFAKPPLNHPYVKSLPIIYDRTILSQSPGQNLVKPPIA